MHSKSTLFSSVGGPTTRTYTRKSYSTYSLPPDYFLDTLTAAVASVTIAPPYKVAFQLKTAALSTFVWKFLELGIPYPYCAQTFIAAIVYVSRIRRDLIATMNGPLLCERIATGAFITACKVRVHPIPLAPHWHELIAAFIFAQHVNRT